MELTPFNGTEQSRPYADIHRFFRMGRDWLKKGHREGLSGREFGRSYSAQMDTVIRRLLKTNLKNPRPAATEFALLAVGGYGREELSPSSDIDLLLVHLPGKGKNLSETLRAVLHPCWDWGLTVGYTVQTPAESARAARKDLKLCLSFLDARWIAGDRSIFFEWQEEQRKAFTPGRQREVILGIRHTAEIRHAHYGDSVFVLEPEVKEGKGGLRDYHAGYWAARIKYHVNSLEELVEKELLSSREGQIFSRALDFLWRVRNQLHLFHERREDRLSFEDQEPVAEALGYKEGNGRTATEIFLKDYFTHALHVHQYSWELLENCIHEEPSERPPARVHSAEVIPGFFLYHGKLAAGDRALFDRNPFHLWKPFEAVHTYGVELSGPLKKTISEHLEYVGERFRTADESTRTFLHFFDHPGHLYRILETMHETGFLQKFIPEFERIHLHVQYDRYHIYPVDIHSLYALRQLEDLERPGGDDSWPLLGQLMKEIKDPGLLKLAALIHDLGKSEGSSHALRGEKIAGSIGERLGLSEERIEALQFLVREHLTYAETASRRDLGDENLIFRFARAMGNPGRLKMLYLLSFADVRAVGPAAWSAWKDTLMRELFLKTLHLLERGEGLEKEHQDRMIRIQGEVMELLEGQIPAPKLSKILLDVPARHYAVYDTRAIGQQILMAERLGEQKVIVEGEEKPEEGCDELTVVAADEPGLFSRISGVITANHLNILSAQISTWENGVAVDSFRVQSLIDASPFEPSRWLKVQEDLRRVLEGKISVDELVDKMPVPLFHRYPSPRSPAGVDIDNEASDFYTVVEIYFHDSPGLLYRITRKIYELGFNIWMARISTKVDQVVDVFYIQDLSGAKVEDGRTISVIKQELMDELERIRRVEGN